MKNLKDILTGIKIISLRGNEDVVVESLHIDSRQVGQGGMFLATKGTLTNGHTYINSAIEKGASSILCEELPSKPEDHITYIQVEDSKEAAGKIAAHFYGHPSKDLNLVGVTGTNGKTTTATLLYRLFSDLGYKVGLISTIENKIGKTTLLSTHTTPDAISMNQLLAEMRDAGCEYVFMEVSSHAVDQKRIAGLHFKGGIFTNLSHDHLDYHETFAKYLKAKQEFFDGLPKTAFALTNIDDKNGNIMVQNTKAKVYPYALKRTAAFKASIKDNLLSGLHLDLDGMEFHGRLIGEFNAYNYLAIYATAMLLDMDRMEVLTALSNIKTAEGRFDYIYSEESKKMAIVDYAHTPDALEKVLETIQELKGIDAKVITVVGCGGDRDKSKRPIMASKACIYSDKVILTSDNPRSEKPEDIIEDMEKGVDTKHLLNVLNIVDRKQAIKTACTLAQSGDIILVAGKGHEKYQEIKGIKNPFDDKEIINQYINLS